MQLTDKQLERYARHIVLKEIGGAGQKRLLSSGALVIGAGGLGSPALLYLAAAGVGHLGLVDYDSVDLSNLQRQILHTTDRIGMPKAESAKAALTALNPDVKLDFWQEKISQETAEGLIRSYDIVLDGSDNFKTRLAVSDACVKTGTTLVSAAVEQFSGQLGVFKPQEEDATGAPYPCYRCFVRAEPGADLDRSCAENGILGAVAGIMGCWQAAEAIKELAGVASRLAGRLLILDALSAETRIVRLARDPACPACGDNGPATA